MDLVDIDDILVTLFLDAVHDLFDAVLEVATILCACQQGADVELIDAAALQAFGYVAFLNHPGESPDQSRLSDTGFSHMQRVVLVASAEYLDGARQFLFPTDQRIVVLVEVVHTGDEASPGGLMLVFARLFLQMVAEFIGTDQFTHEVALLGAQGIFQQIACPRLLELQDAHHQVGDVECLGTAVDHLCIGDIDHLTHECRHLGIIGLTLRHHFRLFEFLFQLLCQCLQVSVVIEDMPETELVDQYHQQVFGHDEFMSVFLAAVNGLFQDGGCTFGLFDLCHFLLLVWFYG